MQQFLGDVVPPVLHSLVDPDARVRYYACEALYNIAKVRCSCELRRMCCRPAAQSRGQPGHGSWACPRRARITKAAVAVSGRARRLHAPLPGHL